VWEGACAYECVYTFCLFVSTWCLFPSLVATGHVPRFSDSVLHSSIQLPICANCAGLSTWVTSLQLILVRAPGGRLQAVLCENSVLSRVGFGCLDCSKACAWRCTCVWIAPKGLCVALHVCLDCSKACAWRCTCVWIAARLVCGAARVFGLQQGLCVALHVWPCGVRHTVLSPGLPLRGHLIDLGLRHSAQPHRRALSNSCA